MCLLFIAWKSHPAYKLILAANRDEYYERPTAPAAFWHEAPDLLAGKDLRAGGTWLGVTRRGRIAAVTNYRDPTSIESHAPSRGRLVTDFLMGGQLPARYLGKLTESGGRYNGYNLIFGDMGTLYWYSNRGDGGRRLPAGLYGLSNHLLDTPWPKVAKGKEAFARILRKEQIPSEALFELLSDGSVAEDRALPHTGVGLEWERVLSPIFITSPVYGTRSSTLVYVDARDRVTFMERTFDSDPNAARTVHFRFHMEF
jgi:uncharacterized protein with NRDE domain